MSERVAREPQWRGQRDATRRRILTLLGVSILLHAPLTPIAALFGLLSLLRTPEEQAAPADTSEINAIPVSLLSQEELEALGGSDEPPAPAPAEPAPAPPADEPVDELFEEPTEPAPAPKAAEPNPREPEQPTSADGGASEKLADQTGKEGELSSDGGVSAEKAEPKQTTGGDPMALVGAVSSVADPNANVRLLVFNDRVRDHPIGPRIGRLLVRLPQWSSFFGPTRLDPVRDFDQIMILGPQLRESADIVAFLQYNVPEATMRQAIDAIVNREPKGKWLTSKVPAAEARADRAVRTFVLAKPGMLVMVPPRLTDDALHKGPKISLPRFKSEVALVAFVATPWRVFIGFNAPFRVPESIRSVIIKVIPTPDSGAVIEIDAVDESPETAQRNSRMLEQGVNLATQRNMGALGALLFGGQTLQLIEPIKLSSDGNKIRGSARVTARQMDRMLNFAESWLDALQNRTRPRVSSGRDTTIPPRVGSPATSPASSATTPELPANPP